MSYAPPCSLKFYGILDTHGYNFGFLQKMAFAAKSTLKLHVHYSTRSNISSSRHRWRCGSSISKGVPLEVVLPSICAQPLQVGDVATQLLDGIHLLVEELAFDEIGHLLNIGRSSE